VTFSAAGPKTEATMKKLGLAVGGTVGLAALVARAARSDELFLGYLLNTFVNKVPLPSARLALYRAAGMRIGPTSNVMMHVRVLSPAGIEIGDHTIIGEYCQLDGRADRVGEGPGLKIGDNVNIGGYSFFIAGGHDPESPDFEGIIKKTVVEDRAWITMNCTVLAGVTIGEGAVVAPMSLVNRDVAPYTMIGGVPAKYLKDRTRDLTYELVNRAPWI
jgi:putative colanic acid biosynthesis acetyltransferase WcaF